MSARMREIRARRHQRLAETFGCDCKRHGGRDARLERMAAELNATVDQHSLEANYGSR